MRSLATFPSVKLRLVHDRDAERGRAFASHWDLEFVDSLDEFLAALPPGDVVLNLTNPSAHAEISRACLEHGLHVYSEKPLATDMAAARMLYDLAKAKDLMLASAPCSVLGEAAQTLGQAIRRGTAGTPRLVYAELDDGFVPQAPYKHWVSESGAPWPYEDEFRVGCTLEHAGYYLSWLIAYFGAVRKVVAASADIIPDKAHGVAGAPDFSVATLFFDHGVIARLTCSIVGPHDHRIRVIGDKGVLQVKQAWYNAAAVRFHRRLTLRRRLMEHPIGKRLRLSGPTHPKVGRKGAAAMNFALGPVEMLTALAENHPCRLASDYALHLNEVTLAIQHAGDSTGAQEMTTSCDAMEPMPWAQ
jgi:predicted dehydrogenase